jgi:hypothetical protein
MLFFLSILGSQICNVVRPYNIAKRMFLFVSYPMSYSRILLTAVSTEKVLC